MDRYLIETPHTASESLDLIKLLKGKGYLSNFDWLQSWYPQRMGHH